MSNINAILAKGELAWDRLADTRMSFDDDSEVGIGEYNALRAEVLRLRDVEAALTAEIADADASRAALKRCVEITIEETNKQLDAAEAQRAKAWEAFEAAEARVAERDAVLRAVESLLNAPIEAYHNYYHTAEYDDAFGALQAAFNAARSGVQDGK